MMFISPFEKLGLLPTFVASLNETQLSAILRDLDKSYKLLYLVDKAGTDKELTGQYKAKAEILTGALDLLSKDDVLSEHKLQYEKIGPGQQSIRDVERTYLRFVTHLEGMKLAIKESKIATTEARYLRSDSHHVLWATSLYSNNLGEIYQNAALYLRHAVGISIKVISEDEFFRIQDTELDLQRILKDDVNQNIQITNLERSIKPLPKKISPKFKDEFSEQRKLLESLKQKKEERKALISRLRDAAKPKFQLAAVDENGCILVKTKDSTDLVSLKVAGSTGEPSPKSLIKIFPQLHCSDNLIAVAPNGKLMNLGIIYDFDGSSDLNLFLNPTFEFDDLSELELVTDEPKADNRDNSLAKSSNPNPYKKNPFEALGLLPDFIKELCEDKETLAEHVSRVIKVLKKILHPDQGGNESLFKEVSEAETLLSNPQTFEVALSEYCSSTPSSSKINLLMQEIKILKPQIELLAIDLTNLKIEEARAKRKRQTEDIRMNTFFTLLMSDLYESYIHPSEFPLSVFARHSNGYQLTILDDQNSSISYELIVKGFDTFALSNSSKLRLIGSSVPHLFSSIKEARDILGICKGKSFSNIIYHLQPVLHPNSFLVAVDDKQDRPIVIGEIKKLLPPMQQTSVRQQSRKMLAK